MTNGHLPTWFVMKWLESHPDHRAYAPKTVTHPSAMLFYIEMESRFNSTCQRVRNDWEICNIDGMPVKFKQRKALERVGTLRVYERLYAIDSVNGLQQKLSPIVVAPHDVFIRERTP